MDTAHSPCTQRQRAPAGTPPITLPHLVMSHLTLSSSHYILPSNIYSVCPQAQRAVKAHGALPGPGSPSFTSRVRPLPATAH